MEQVVDVVKGKISPFTGEQVQVVAAGELHPMHILSSWAVVRIVVLLHRNRTLDASCALRGTHQVMHPTYFMDIYMDMCVCVCVCFIFGRRWHR